MRGEAMKPKIVVVILFFCITGVFGWYFTSRRFYESKPIVKPHNNLAKDTQVDSADGYINAGKQKEIINVLLLGVDAKKKEASRTDAIMLVNINQQNKQVTVISVPRDTRIEIPGIGSTKINHAHILGELAGNYHEGTKASLQAVSDLLQCDIHYYIKLNFEEFRNLIDIIGGIEIELERPINTTKLQIQATKQHIDGEQALKLARERYSLPEGDFGRQKHQFLILKSAAKKVLSTSAKLPELLNQYQNSVIGTNLMISDIITLIWFLKDLTDKDIIHVQIPGHSSYQIDAITKTRLYYWIPDPLEMEKISDQYLIQ
jgi:polyisoprenyl-teichoic acid--peptidoglycan teichoic acid transferase